MPTNEKFKMLKKPREPKRIRHQNYLSLVDDCSMQEILNVIKRIFNISLLPADVTIRQEQDYYDDSFTIKACWDREESKETFQQRMEKYKKDLSAWEGWYKAHRSKIEASLEDKKRITKERQKNRILNEKKRLEQKLQQLEKTLQEKS